MSAPDAGRDEGSGSAAMSRLIRVEFAVRWRDLDAFNHVNNANFLTYLEEARLRWLDSLGGPWIDAAVAPLLAAVQVNYRRPIGWPGSVAVELFAERVGNSSLTFGHRIVAADDAGCVHADGNTVLVWIDRASGRPCPLPAAVRAAAQPSGWIQPELPSA